MTTILTVGAVWLGLCVPLGIGIGKWIKRGNEIRWPDQS